MHELGAHKVVGVSRAFCIGRIAERYLDFFISLGYREIIVAPQEDRTHRRRDLGVQEVERQQTALPVGLYVHVCS
jgi:hypothetical protein